MSTRQNSRCSLVKRCAIWGLASLCWVSVAFGAKTWTGGAGNWNAGGNWDPSGVPGAGDDVVISASGANVLLDAATTINSLVVGNASTLTFTNWTTKLTMSGDVTVQAGGMITLPPPFPNAGMSNRVWIACNSLTVDANGAIDVVGKGFGKPSGEGAGPGGSGPYPGIFGSAGHGGAGGFGVVVLHGAGGRVYDSATDPEQPGSSSSDHAGWDSFGGTGGGVIRIEAGGDVTVNGTLTANGSDGTGANGSGGSGGTINIACHTILGTSGTVSAAGGATPGYVGYFCSGGGGRIAVAYNSAAQATVSPVPAIRFDAGTKSTFHDSVANLTYGDLGTLYFPDNYFLSPTITSLSGQWMVPNFTNWSVSSLLISNAWIRFPASNFKLTVAGDLTVIGTGIVPSAGLGLGGSNIYVHRTFSMPYSSGTGPELSVGGNLTLTNGGLLGVYAGETNVAKPYGALVSVGGELGVASNSCVYPHSQPMNGGCVKFSVGSLRVDNGGQFDAGLKGYASGNGYWGFGPGAGGGYGGGSYGGKGGTVGSEGEGGVTLGPYGSSNAPVECGSAGGDCTYGWGPGGNGGGLIWVEAQNKMTLNGTLTAIGETCNDWRPSGAGGGIYLRTGTLQGSSTGHLVADGGSQPGIHGGSGGGGRIAVWRMRDTPPGLESVISSSANPGAIAGSMDPPTAGTIVWGIIPPPQGTVISMH